ncbi:MAG: hypothetical protein NC131_06125 [Roseburia sp.]|nr:hypothetical protein [Roseburia sp.]
MDKDKITRYQWKKYLQLQRTGKINMNDATKGAKLIGESVEVYKTIIFNYAYLKKKFGNWAKAMRSTIKGLLNTGQVKIGQTIGFSDELDFFTSFIMEPSDEVIKKHYLGTVPGPNGLEYRGVICNNY